MLDLGDALAQLVLWSLIAGAEAAGLGLLAEEQIVALAREILTAEEAD